MVFVNFCNVLTKKFCLIVKTVMTLEAGNIRPSFKGNDARPLKAVIMRWGEKSPQYLDVIKRLEKIGRENEFDVFVQTPKLLVTEI